MQVADVKEVLSLSDKNETVPRGGRKAQAMKG